MYSTREEVIGLMTFPSEDETHIQCMGVVAHAGPIACMEVSFDSKYVITCGGQDRYKRFCNPQRVQQRSSKLVI